MNTALKPVWAGREMRLDPARLPQTVSYATSDHYGDVTFTVNPRGVVVHRMLSMSGLPAAIALPARAFLGVAARAIDDGHGEVTVTLELMHADPALSVPLLVAHDLEDVAADWRSWARSYQLPMLLVEADGVARSLDDSLGALNHRQAAPRRKRSSSTPRRARFSARRKPGNLGLRLVVGGEEIISRT